MIKKETLQQYSYWLQDLLIDKGTKLELAMILNIIVNIIIISIIVFLIDLLLKKIIVFVFKTFSNKTKTTFDDFLVVSNFPRFIAHSFPILIARYVIPILFNNYPETNKFLIRMINILIIILCVYIFRSILRTTHHFLKQKDKYKDKPLESYVQVLMIFTWGLALFLILSMLTGYSTISIASLGTVSAIILLIFKDTILGFVASIQISVNDIVRIGDWITFKKFGADGYVTEINLATVKVQNFDYTYTTIPTYSLIADSFQNWRGMQESNGRRIKRAIYIKQNSIHFLTEENINSLIKIDLLKDFISNINIHKYKYNDEQSINQETQTNLDAFIKYANTYIKKKEELNKNMYFMVRCLEPSPQGLPVEFICFSYEKKWEIYEELQTHILNHFISTLPYFNLEIFEIPTGVDLKSLAKK
ncbi:MAG: mechanosensitive ion channel family protein [Flavobacteriales bacterium]